jgi:hypothetical protein
MEIAHRFIGGTIGYFRVSVFTKLPCIKSSPFSISLVIEYAHSDFNGKLGNAIGRPAPAPHT